MTSAGTVTEMRAVMIDPDPAYLEQRRRNGWDRHDEVWDGVLHLVPPPTSFHQGLGTELVLVLSPIAKALGLRVFCGIGLFDPIQGEANFRQPDVVVADPKYITRRGIEGRAELVVEILSPRDESRDKLPFYAHHGCQEVWLVDPETRAFEVYVLRGGTYFAATPTRAGVVEAPRLGLELETTDGKLRIGWADGSAEIE